MKNIFGLFLIICLIANISIYKSHAEKIISHYDAQKPKNLGQAFVIFKENILNNRPDDYDLEYIH
jgi:hypothetical protein